MVTVITWTFIIICIMGMFKVFHVRWEKKRTTKRQYEERINKALTELTDATTKFKSIMAQSEKSNHKDMDR